MNALLLSMLLLVQGGVTAPVAQGGVISGRILALDGTPVANKRIAAEAVLDRNDVDLGASMLAGISQTDRDGRFRLENIPPGRYYIVLDPLDLPSYYPGVAKKERAEIVSVAEGSLIASVDFKMPDFDGGKVFGRLAAPLLPPAGPVLVGMLPSASVLSPDILARLGTPGVISIFAGFGGGRPVFTSGGSNPSITSAPVNADGTFEMPKVRPGMYTISTTTNIGLSSALVNIDDADVHDVRLDPPGATPATTSGVTVRGRIVQEAVPELASQFSVMLSRQGELTPDRQSIVLPAGPNVAQPASPVPAGPAKVPVNPDGTFAFSNVSPGVYVAMTIPSPSASNHTVVEVTDQNVDIEVVLPYTIEVSGHIEMEDGSKLKPLSRAIVLEASHVDIKPLRTTVQPDGTFKMNLLAGDNRILIRNIPMEYSVVSMTYESIDLLTRSFLPDLGDTDGIRIVLAPAKPGVTHRVSGIVAGLPSLAIGPNTKLVVTGTGLGRRISETTINPDGTFEFPGLPEDTYSAQVTGAPFELDLKFQFVDQDVDLRLRGNIRSPITGRVAIVDRNGTILPGFPFNYMTAEFTSPSGANVIPVRSDGTFAFLLNGGEYSFGTNKFPEGYSVKSVTAGGSDLLKGRLNIDGRPIPEITVTLEYRPKSNP